jgi:hypothetical protein
MPRDGARKCGARVPLCHGTAREEGPPRKGISMKKTKTESKKLRLDRQMLRELAATKHTLIAGGCINALNSHQSGDLICCWD